MKKEIRIAFHADQALADDLKQRSIETGVPVSEIIRRSVRLAAFADQRPRTSKGETR
ncbi:MAG TPA: ribbon-helix-helix protein, CopG family [Terriglobales bacterium]|jgi:hypothetical protein|nr:ribbon-helix-helix protein, CopG family [Terriglobales bacterium]